MEGFTVELDVYSGPYEWLLALILRDELEIFEVPLRELVDLYLDAKQPEDPDSLERDTDFAGSAAALVLLKSRSLSPALDEDEALAEEPLSPEQLAERLTEYLKIQRGAGEIQARFEANRGFYPTSHTLKPRPGALQINSERLIGTARRTFSRLTEPPVKHLGPITVTLQELVEVIRASLTRGAVSYEELVQNMDRLRSAVTFAAALSLAHEGNLILSQSEPLGPLTFRPAS